MTTNVTAEESIFCLNVITSCGKKPFRLPRSTKSAKKPLGCEANTTICCYTADDRHIDQHALRWLLHATAVTQLHAPAPLPNTALGNGQL